MQTLPLTDSKQCITVHQHITSQRGKVNDITGLARSYLKDRHTPKAKY